MAICHFCGRARNNAIGFYVTGGICQGCRTQQEIIQRERYEADQRHKELLEALKTPAQRRAEARELLRLEEEEKREKNERFKSFKIKFENVRAPWGEFSRGLEIFNRIKSGEEILVLGDYGIKLDYTNERHKNKSKYGFWFGDSDAKSYIKTNLERKLNSGKAIDNLLPNLSSGKIFFTQKVLNQANFNELKINLFELQEKLIFCVVEVIMTVQGPEPSVGINTPSVPSNGMNMKALAESSAKPIGMNMKALAESSAKPIGMDVNVWPESSAKKAEDIFSLFLQGEVQAIHKISIINAIRNITKMGLADAKTFVEAEGLRLIKNNLSRQQAIEMKQQVEEVGGSIVIRPNIDITSNPIS